MTEPITDAELNKWLVQHEGATAPYGSIGINRIDRLIAEVRRLRALVPVWQPIGPEQKDGRWMLIIEKTGTWADYARFVDGEWRSHPDTIFGPPDGSPAVYWAELPYLEPEQDT